jgi:GT2 family glycosyltransferase
MDPEQPRISSASFLTRLRHYRNLGKMSRMIEYYLRDGRFGRIADHLGLDLGPASTAAPTPRSNPELIVTRSPRPPVTVVVPCYDEEATLPYLVNTLRSTQAHVSAYDLRFIFVDDGSTDGTLAALHRLFGDWPNTRVLEHGKNQGVAAAILTGVRKARTEIVCSMDCDCTYDPFELAKMIPLLEPDVDLVTASPYHKLGRVLFVPRWRLALSKTASFLYRRVLRQQLATYTSCFRVYRRSVLLDVAVREPGYLGIAEMVAELDQRGSRMVEFPATLETRVLGRSKMKTLRTIAGHLRLLARLAFRRMRGWPQTLSPLKKSPPPPVDKPPVDDSADSSSWHCERTLA